ncbi:HAD family hydrolase [Aliidiomarina taiwanensis]|uniref:HAD family hydrolase n=1 Tax=Aliidiomarina taiwanensis TaxID=946228 RepID=A0A432X7D9_9GAMM|nr:GMP/IMP nucleotidase [Aliidiomarina taiwanensis]RUO42773.1 HAD family hydrolase [Aliidiomarina taiwanensis]
MLNWSDIDTVLLDMDGTLLDLHYDNHFWNQYILECYAKEHNIATPEAQAFFNHAFSQVAGTLHWYCIDYWEQTLELPIRALKKHYANKIKYRPDAPGFLDALKQAGKDMAIITNAHPDVLALKNQYTDLKTRCPEQFSTHSFGYCKEFQELWQNLQTHYHFDPKRTLFVDDGEHILDSARTFGIRYTLGIETPDSQKPATRFSRHMSVASFAELHTLN